MRIAGFIDSKTLNIIDSRAARKSRCVHRGCVDLARHKAKYNWVWIADAAGTLLPFHVEGGVLYPDCVMDSDVYALLKYYVSVNGLYELSLKGD